MDSNRSAGRRGVWAVVLALLLGAHATRPSVDAGRPHGAAPVPEVAETDAPFPDRTPSDVVSYADHVVLVTAISEREVEREVQRTPSPSVEPTIPRRITFRVEQTLWSRPAAPPPPARLDPVWWGWLVKEGRRVPLVVQGTPWVVVGAQYVMPIAQDGAAFTPIQPFAVFRFGDGAVALEEQDTLLARQLANASRDGVTSVFTRAIPDPMAARYAHLPPRARLAAVMEARSSASPDRE